MQTYREYSPTSFDTKGLLLPDQQDWFVVIGRNRDSGHLDNSNFDSALASMGGESDDVEIHNFGHWACGWLEIIIVRPNTDASRTAEEIRERLENYPVLDEHDYCEREYEAAAEYWDSMSPRAKVRYAMDARSRYHWLASEPVWPYGRLSYGDVCDRGDTISEYIRESLRED
jgi:hypothetical protein